MQVADIWDEKSSNFIITQDAVRIFARDVQKPTRYYVDEQILEDLVPKFIKQDSSFKDIYTIVTLINSFYSTRMGPDDCFARANLLFENHNRIWAAIHNLDVATVQNIIDLQRQGDRPVSFSFTTKYFSILSRYVAKQDIYPIYDSKVAKLLNYYFYKQNHAYTKSRVSGCNTPTVKDYITYYNIISEIMASCKVSYKELDNYLWQLGTNLDNNINGAWTKPGTDIHAVLQRLYEG
ncbi:MAG: hypothetical protein J5613_03325 [Alphaproteobacteria bacterium]|nr:hypothetical protein [Alphaproteobacteria bacterium]